MRANLDVLAGVLDAGAALVAPTRAVGRSLRHQLATMAVMPIAKPNIPIAAITAANTIEHLQWASTEPAPHHKYRTMSDNGNR